MAGLYIHFPFCKRKCPYCDFYSVADLSLIDVWLNYLEKEVERYLPFWPQAFETFYLGGGSPSLLEAGQLKKLNKILNKFKFTLGLEKTIELNPEDVNLSKIKLWEECGFNRLSLGVQSFQEKFLKNSLNRNHSVLQSIEAIENIKKFDFNLSLDLIYGHFGQTEEDWVFDLETLVKFNPQHISAYILTAEEGTQLFKNISLGKSNLLEEETSARLFYLTAEVLKKYNYARYEVSNFSLLGFRAKHNYNYWVHNKYLALGPSAHSFNGHYRWANWASLTKWINGLNGEGSKYMFSEKISQEIKNFESIMLGLRLADGFEYKLLKKTSHKILEEYIKGGFLILKENRVQPTEKGFLFADKLAVDLT